MGIAGGAAVQGRAAQPEGVLTATPCRRGFPRTAGHPPETIGILICGTTNDCSVRYILGRSTSQMAVAAYTYDQLPPAEQRALPNEGHLVAALEWAEPGADVPE